MVCPECGKKLPENAVKCNKCGKVFKEVKINTETEAYLKKEKEKAADKAKKKSEKKPVDKKKILKIVIPVIAVILAAAVIFAVVSHIMKKKEQERIDEIRKTAPELLIEYTFDEVSKEDAVLSLGDINIGEAEYEFFYRQSFSNVQNSARVNFNQYAASKLGDSYDENADYYNQFYEEYSKDQKNLFDYTKPVNAQNGNAVDENGKEMSWQEYIRNDAIKSVTKFRIKYTLAQKAGIKLTDDIRYQVYTHIEDLRALVNQSAGVSFSQYLQNLFGPSCDEEFFKNELIREYTASKYDSVIGTQKADSYSDEEIKKIYQSERAAYDYIDLCIYEATDEKTVKKIEKDTTGYADFSAAVKKNINESSDMSPLPVVPKQYIDQMYSTDMGKWAFSKDRKADDMKVFKTSNGYALALIQKPAYSSKDCVNYREIVFRKTDDNNMLLSEDKIAEAKKNAQAVLDKWNGNDKTEDTFIYYVLTNSNGSTASSGGLVSNMSSDNLQEKLKAWASDKTRKTGDVELIETDTEFSIVYFIKNYGENWNGAIRTAKAGEDTAKDFTDAQTGAYALKMDSGKIEKQETSMITEINRLYFGITQ